MPKPDPITGAEFLARSLAANGTTHVFFIDAVLRRTLIELGTLGVQRALQALHVVAAAAPQTDRHGQRALHQRGGGLRGRCTQALSHHLARVLQADAPEQRRCGHRDHGRRARTSLAATSGTRAELHVWQAHLASNSCVRNRLGLFFKQPYKTQSNTPLLTTIPQTLKLTHVSKTLRGPNGLIGF